MKILIVNDDSISAAQLMPLIRWCQKLGDVTVVVPEYEQSGKSHGIQLLQAFHAEKRMLEDVEVWAVDSTPADCVRLGLYITREDPVDCVLTGINNGSNRGAAILYSGTVGAALEGSLCGVPALAVSLCSHLDKDYEHAAILGVKTLEWAMENPLPRGEVYNLNVPYGPDIKGVKSATVSNEFIFPALYDELSDGGYQLKNPDSSMPETDENSDLNVTNAGYASLSIISWNMLAKTPMPDLGKLNGEVGK